MKDIKINISEIKTNSIEINESLFVYNKQFVIWMFFFILSFLLFFIIYAFHFHWYLQAIIVTVFTILFTYDRWSIYFPFKLPLLIVDKDGIKNKNTFFPWIEIDTVIYEIQNKNYWDRNDSLELYLKKGKKIVIVIDQKSIDTSIEVIAAYINYYKKKLV